MVTREIARTELARIIGIANAFKGIPSYQELYKEMRDICDRILKLYGV